MPATHGSHCAIFYQNQLSNYTQNIRCWYPLSMADGMQRGCCITQRHNHYLWSVSKQSLAVQDRWKKLLTASVSHIWALLCLFPPSSILKLHTKHQISGSHWVQQMGCHTARNAIHWCSWSILKPNAMYKADRKCFWQYLPATYGSHWAILRQGQLSNCT